MLTQSFDERLHAERLHAYAWYDGLCLLVQAAWNLRHKYAQFRKYARAMLQPSAFMISASLG